jgi:two-component system sensor histidine kinase SenX3
VTRRQTASIVFVVLCVVLVAAAVILNIGWILANPRSVAPLVFGVIAFSLIIAGIIIYTVFLVREMGITEQQDSFLNSVTHELKTPIASIRLYLETLQSRDVGDAQRKEFYRIMLQDAERLQSTVEQVLRAGAARQQSRLHHIAPVDLGWLAGECVDTARQRHNLPAEAVSMVDFDPNTALVVDGDVDDLRTAIANLLDNAVKYSSGPPRVIVQAAGPTPDTAWIRVKDAGVGIPRAQLNRIFHRFYRFQGAFKTKGTGLGLFIVRSIAKRHGGRVYAESAGEGKGATFTLELPRAKSPVSSERKKVEGPALSELSPDERSVGERKRVEG